MKNNFDFLIEQFIKAKNIKNPNIYSKQFIKDFNYWLGQRKIIGNEFLHYLDSYGLDYKSSKCAEVDKGEYDTLVRDYETKILSLEAPSIKGVDEDRFMYGRFRIYDGNAALLLHHDITLIPSSEVETYFVHNPYSFTSIEGIWDMHNYGINDIILGVYGSVYDKDKSKKIAKLNSIKDRLTRDFDSEYDIYDDSYYYFIASKPRIRK